MKSIFKATAILGSSSVISIIVGLISSKLLAKMIGPTGIGYLAMLQGFLALTVMISGLGVSTGTVRTIAKAIEDKNKDSIASNQKAAILLSIISGFVTLLLILLFRNFFNRLMLDNQGDWYEISLLGIGLIFTLLANCFVGIINAYHNIKVLAQIAIFNNIFNVIFLIFFVWLFDIKGLIIGVIAGTIFNFVLSFYFYKREIPTLEIEVSLNKILTKIRSLLKFGIPHTASMIVGGGVQLILPLLILHHLDLDNVGFYRAASTISVTSLSLILNAMGQDYYPRLARISDDKKLLTAAINDQLYFALLMFSPMILWLLLLSPKIILFLYSAQFSKTSEILSIMLIGDIFKLLSWLLAFVILARNRSGMFFFGELLGGIFMLIANYLGIQYFGIAGVGIGYTIGYFCYFLAVWYLVKREINVCFTLKNKCLILYILALSLSVFTLSNYGVGNINVYIAVGFCLIASLISIVFFVNDFLGYRESREEKDLINE